MIPVFVVGSPRSGTTMLGAMLGSASNSVVIPESPYVAQTCYRYLINEGPCPRQDVIEALSTSHRTPHWKIDVDWSEFSGAPEMPGDEFRQVMECLLHKFAAANHRENPGYWVEHSPSNGQFIQAIRKIFPNAHFVHIVRDGRAVAASILPLDWGATNMQEAATHWVRDLGYCFQGEKSVDRKCFQTVRYEELVRHPEEVLQKLCEQIGIRYNPKIVLGQAFDVPSYNGTQHTLVGKQPDVSRLNSWEKRLSTRQIEIFELYAGPMLYSLGYSLKSKYPARTLSFFERLRFTVRRLYRHEFTNRIRSRRRRNL